MPGCHATGENPADVGAPRSGKTSALRTIIAAVAATSSSRQVNFHIIDFAASGLHDLEILPHVSSVTYRGDDERLRRVIQIVAAEVTRRERIFRQKHWASVEEARAGGLADIFLVLDGMMITLATFVLNFLHPGWLLGPGPWPSEAAWENQRAHSPSLNTYTEEGARTPGQEKMYAAEV